MAQVPDPYELLDIACETENISTARGRGIVAVQMAWVIAQIPDAIPRNGFFLAVSNRLRVSSSILAEEVAKAMAEIRLTNSPNGRSREP
jgi:hypothetical protein